MHESLMPEAVVVRCSNVKCRRFQRIWHELASMDDYIECTFCKRKQRCTAFVHPVSKEPLRGYDTERLKKHVEELTEKYGMPAGRGKLSSVWARSERYAETAMGSYSGRSAPTTKGGSYSQNDQPALGSKATTLVPANVSFGDQLVLTCADGRRVRVIVEEPNA